MRDGLPLSIRKEESLTVSVTVIADPSTQEPVGVTFSTGTIGTQAISPEELSNVTRDTSVTQKRVRAIYLAPIL